MSTNVLSAISKTGPENAMDQGYGNDLIITEYPDVSTNLEVSNIIGISKLSINDDISRAIQ